MAFELLESNAHRGVRVCVIFKLLNGPSSFIPYFATSTLQMCHCNLVKLKYLNFKCIIK